MSKYLAFCAFTVFTASCATISENVDPHSSPVSTSVQEVSQKEYAKPIVKTYKRKVAIARFTNETNYGRALMTDNDFNRIGKQASDMLASRLVQSDSFVVLERPDAIAVTREQELQSFQNTVGADVLIIGSVTEFGRSVGGKSGFLSHTKVQTARARVDVRLVDVKTGHAFFSSFGVGEASSASGEIAGFGSRAEYDATLNDRAIAASISDMIDKLISTLKGRAWKTDILDVQGVNVYVSGGERQGLKAGDFLAVMEENKNVQSKQTGFNIALPPKKIGTIKVIGFFGDNEQNEGSICELVNGSLDKVDMARIFVTEEK